jgi:hypothetical protein
MATDADAAPTPDEENGAPVKVPEDNADAGNDKDPDARVRGWRNRPSVRTIRKGMRGERDFWKESDQRDNEASRLPVDETVHLGGITLVEAFTPSTIFALYDALDKLPSGNPGKKQEWLRALRSSRGRSYGGGWQSLAIVLPPGGSILSALEGFRDSTLPKGVAAVWLELHYPTASLAMVVATFTFEEEAGDLSALLLQDYKTQMEGAHLQIHGRLGNLRARVPWARPSGYSFIQDIQNVEAQKRLAYENVASKFEESCWRWFTARFPGRFAAEPLANRPAVRQIFTRKSMPFKGHPEYLRPVGLAGYGTVWRSTDFEGWAIKLDNLEFVEKRRSTIVAAARRSDAAREPDSEDGTSVWYLTQRFHEYHGSLVVRWAMTSLMSLYGDRLGVLRDHAGRRRRFGRPIRQARELDGFLLGDGLDASTVASDIRALAGDLNAFRWNVAEYSEDLEDYPQALRDKRDPFELVPMLCESLGRRAKRLLEDMGTTTANVGASAQLRQSIASTRLQRAVLVLTVVATVIAIVSLVA